MNREHRKKSAGQPAFRKLDQVECPVAYALRMIGGKWKLPLLWHLHGQETVRYNELKRSVTGITSMMLSKSLRELEEDGLVNRVQYDGVPRKVEYRLSKKGFSLVPVLREIYRWAEEQITCGEDR